MTTVRRVVVYLAVDGWRWKAQGNNWRTIEVSKRGFKSQGGATASANRRFPDAEVVWT